MEEYLSFLHELHGLHGENPFSLPMDGTANLREQMQKRLAANEESSEYQNSIRCFSYSLHLRERFMENRKFPRMEKYLSFLHELHALHGENPFLRPWMKPRIWAKTFK